MNQPAGIVLDHSSEDHLVLGARITKEGQHLAFVSTHDSAALRLFRTMRSAKDWCPSAS